MPGINSLTPYDHSGLVKVSVIASFDTNGHIRPLYIRFGEEALKVHSFSEKPSTMGFREFRCQVIDNDCLKPLALTYRTNDNVWTIAERKSI